MPFEEVTIGDCRLIRADCMDVLPTLGIVDAVVTDPPYGIGWKPRVNHHDSPWQDNVYVHVDQWLDVGSQHIFWGAQYYARALPVSSAWLTWVKRPTNFDFSDDPRTYATTELAWCDFGKARHFVHCWDGGKRAGVSENRTFCHPSQKPVELMRWCVEMTSGSVCDPFMGSGTTGIACTELGRAFIGIEREPKYFDIACRRIEDAYGKGTMFDDTKRKEPELFPCAKSS